MSEFGGLWKHEKHCTQGKKLGSAVLRLLAFSRKSSLNFLCITLGTRKLSNLICVSFLGHTVRVLSVPFSLNGIFFIALSIQTMETYATSSLCGVCVSVCVYACIMFVSDTTSTIIANVLSSKIRFMLYVFPLVDKLLVRWINRKMNNKKI